MIVREPAADEGLGVVHLVIHRSRLTLSLPLVALRPGRLGFLFLLVRVGDELLDLAGEQLSPCPGGQVGEFQGTDGDPFQTQHLVADAGQHAADFAVFTFVQHHDHVGAVAPLAFDLDRLDLAETIGQVNAAFELREAGLLGFAGDADQVGLFDAVTRMSQPVGELAIVGHQDQSFAVAIEAADRENSLLGRDQVDDAHPAAGVEVGRDDAHRLVDGEVHPLRLADRLTIDADLVLQRIDLGAELGHHLAIDFDPTFADQFFTIASAADAGGGEHLLQAFGAGGFSRIATVLSLLALRTLAARWFGARHNGNFLAKESGERAATSNCPILPLHPISGSGGDFRGVRRSPFVRPRGGARWPSKNCIRF